MICDHSINSKYSSVSPDIRFKETPYVNFFTDPELSSSLYLERVLLMFKDNNFNVLTAIR